MRYRALASLLLLVFATTACSEGGGTADPATPAATQPSSQAATGPCRLTLGWEPLEPYEYRNEDGELAGLDIELARAVFAAAHCQVQAAEGRWGTLVRRLQRGDVNVLAGALRTPERESYALFSDPLRNQSAALYVRKGDVTVQRSTSLEALLDTGFRLGVKEQYSYGETVDKLQENPRYTDQFVGATNSEQNYQRLLDLEIDGFLEDPVAARTVMRKKGMQEEIAAHPLAIYSGDVAFMFSKASVDPLVVTRINEALAKVRASGEYQDIVDRYAN